MKSSTSIQLVVVLLATACCCCLVAADMNAENCRKLYKDSNANWDSASQVFQCYEKFGLGNELVYLSHVVSDSHSSSNCASSSKLLSLEHFNLDKATKSTKRAFLAYALRLSASCRNDMVKVVSSQLEGIVGDEDFAELDRLTSDNSPVAKLFALDDKNKGLALPSPMVKLLKAQDKVTEGQIAMYVPKNTPIARVQAVCLRRFKPIYDKIMNPLIKLASMGFNYEPETSLTVDERVAKKIAHWYRVVFACKLLDKFDIIEDSSVPAGHMTFMNGNLGFYNPSKRALNYPEIKEVKFDYELVDERQVSSDDRLVDVNDRQLMKSIKDFHEPSFFLGTKAIMKLTGTSLSQKLANTFGGQGKNGGDAAAAAAAAADDEGMAGFFAKYSEHLKTLVDEPERKPSKGNRLVKRILKDTLQWALLPVFLLFPFTIPIAEYIEHGQSNPGRFRYYRS